MPYLLDADWAIEALAGRRNADKILANLLDEGVVICWVTVGEMYEGAFRILTFYWQPRHSIMG